MRCVPFFDQAVLYIRELEEANDSLTSLLLLRYTTAFEVELGLSAVALPNHLPGRGGERAVVVKGAHAFAVAGVEAGTHLFCCARQTLRLVQVHVWPFAGEDPRAVLTTQANARQQWLRSLAKGRASADEDPFAWQPVIRIYDETGPTVDLRSGLLSPTFPDADSLRTFVLAALPLPPELHL